MIRLYVHGQIDKRKIKRLRIVCKTLSKIVNIKHVIPVHVVPARRIYIESDGTYCFACYKKSRPLIYLSGRWCLKEIVEDLIHALVHYEQYRDGKKIQERGVNVRSRSIIRKLYEVLPRYGRRSSKFCQRSLQSP